MKASEFEERLRIEVPNIGTMGLESSQIYRLLSQAVDQVNLITKVYRGYTDFNVTAEVGSYSLSTVAPTFLGMAKEGVYFKDANSQWQVVYPKTRAWVAKFYPGWLNATSAALPRWYWVEGDEISFYNKPSTTRTSGARVYHLKKGTVLTNADYYPFSGTTESVDLIPLDDAIIAYVKMKLVPSFGKNTDIDLMRRDFLAECRKGAKQIRRRPDLTLDSTYTMTI